jgi:hypothetical protein
MYSDFAFSVVSKIDGARRVANPGRFSDQLGSDDRQLVLGSIPILVPSLVIAGLWRSWSHAGDFTLKRADKLLRTAIFVVLVAAFVALMLSIFAPHDKSGSLDWNEI